MRLALLSDIHANSFALEAVLADIRRYQVDRIINLGDLLYGPVTPHETLELLQAEEVVSIAGNQDRYLWQCTDQEVAANPTLAFVREQIGTAGLAWLRALPDELLLDDAVYLCHGAPGDDQCYLLEDVSSGRAQLRTEAELVARLHGVSTPLICCGHSHTARVVQMASGQLVVNPGSVGLPAYRDEWPLPHVIEQGNVLACYSLLEQAAGGWLVRQMQIPYPVHLAAEAARRQQRSDWADALSSGRASG